MNRGRAVRRAGSDYGLERDGVHWRASQGTSGEEPVCLEGIGSFGFVGRWAGRFCESLLWTSPNERCGGSHGRPAISIRSGKPLFNREFS